MDSVKATYIVLLVGTLACARASFDDQLDWLKWRLKYNKNYKTEESEVIHRQTLERNKAYVEAHNNRHDVQFKLELNEFADQEPKKRPQLYSAKAKAYKKSNSKLLFQPSSWDWRQHGAVTPVKSQGQFSDSQAIVTAECVESYHFIKRQVLPDLSAAEAHDCCTPTPLVDPNVFQCVHNIGGLCSAGDYPQPTTICRNNSCTAVAQVEGGMLVSGGDENSLVEAVLKTPVLAVINAGVKSFQFYRSGVYNDPSCNSHDLDHVIQVVGYGSQNGTDYWICKNSWGVNWGMRGYILIARNQGNMCGIASMAQYPV